MAKRFFASEIWEEDWFLEMPNEYRWFWFYMLAKCDHAGVFRVNPRSIRGKIEAEVTPSRALELINTDKQRVRVLKDGVWLIEDFFVFQYGPKFNINNLVHKSIANVYAKHGIDINSIRGLTEVNLTPKPPRRDPKHGAKDKDKDIEGDELVGGKKEEEGLGEGERKGGEREEFVAVGIGPQMVQAFKSAFPEYPEDTSLDFSACLEIAYKIAKSKGWTKESVTNGRQADVVSEWMKMVGFIKSDKWYKTRSISGINKQFQDLIQSIKNGTSVKGTNQSQPIPGIVTERGSRKF